MGKRLYVGNLSYDSTEDTVRNAFSASGNVTDVHIMMDRDTGRPRGFGFVEMSTDQEAQAAIEAMDGQDLDGRGVTNDVGCDVAQNRGGGHDERSIGLTTGPLRCGIAAPGHEQRDGDDERRRCPAYACCWKHLFSTLHCYENGSYLEMRTIITILNMWQRHMWTER